MDNTKKYFDRKKRFEILESDGIYEKIACTDEENVRYSKLFVDELPFDIVRENNDELDKSASVPLKKDGTLSARSSDKLESEIAIDAFEDLGREDDVIYTHYKYIKCENYEAERDMRILCGIKKITVLAIVLIVLVLVVTLIPHFVYRLN